MQAGGGTGRLDAFERGGAAVLDEGKVQATSETAGAVQVACGMASRLRQ